MPRSEAITSLVASRFAFICKISTPDQRMRLEPSFAPLFFIALILFLPLLSFAQLSGSYTINAGAAATSTNFISVQSAADSLHLLGVSGPVEISVVPGSGPYNETVTIDSIPGASPVNSIVFNGNGDTLTYSSFSSSNNYTLGFDNVSHVTVKHFVLVNTSVVNLSVVWFGNGSDSNLIDSNTILITHESLTLNSNQVGVSVPFNGGGANDLRISHNNIIGGDNGVVMSNGWGNTIRSMHITDNVIRDFKYTGISFGACDSAIISGNDISRPNRNLTRDFRGIAISGNSGSVNNRIYNNRIHTPHGPASNANFSADHEVNAIYLLQVVGTASQPNLVYNNLIYDINNRTDVTRGIYASNCSYVEFYHNTIDLSNENAISGETEGFFHSSYAPGIVFKHNLIYINRGGVSILSGINAFGGGGYMDSDYNAVYVNSTGTGSTFFGRESSLSFHPTLEDWQLSEASDLNSVDANPFMQYTNGGLPVPAGANLDGMAAATVGVQEDIFGNTRSNPTDPGAIEFSASGSDAAVYAITGPVSPSTTWR